LRTPISDMNLKLLRHNLIHPSLRKLTTSDTSTSGECFASASCECIPCGSLNVAARPRPHTDFRISASASIVCSTRPTTLCVDEPLPFHAVPCH
jgi:hypothetical protein